VGFDLGVAEALQRLGEELQFGLLVGAEERVGQHGGELFAIENRAASAF